MSVHYKFKSALDYDTVTFDGLHISVGDLKAAISQQKRIGKNYDFDLQITNAQTKEVYEEDNTLIPKNTSLVVARVPLSQQPKKQWEGKNNESQHKDVAINKGHADLAHMEGTEQDKINAMISQSTFDYDPSNYQKIRGQNQRGVVPPNYICYKCHKRGHWIKECPLSKQTTGESVEIRRSTGIPRSFMVPVDGPKTPGAMMTPSGTFAVPVVDREAYLASENAGGPEVPSTAAVETTIPDELICSLCRDLLTDAVMIPCCGNSFCDECIRSALLESEDHECPDCREKEISPTTLIPNRFLRTNVSLFRNETGYTRRVPHRPAPQPQLAPAGPVITLPNAQTTNGVVKEITENNEADVNEGTESDGSGDDNITVTVPPAHAHRGHRTYHPAHRHPARRIPHRYDNQGNSTAPNANNAPQQQTLPPIEEQRSSTPTVDERRDSNAPPRQMVFNRPPPFMPEVPPPHFNHGYSGRHGPPSAGSNSRFPMDYQPPPPGIKEPSIIAGEDPLEAFNRMIREKEERAKRREEERRRMHSPRSQSRTPPRIRSRSPPPLSLPPRPRTPLSRGSSRLRYSRSRSKSRGRSRRSPWSPRRRRSRERSISFSRSPPSPRRRHRSPLRYRTPLRSPPPRLRDDRSPHHTPPRTGARSPSRNLSPRYSGVYADMSPLRSVEPTFGARFPRNNGPPPTYPSKHIPPPLMPPHTEPGFRGRYDVPPPFEDVPPGIDPPIPGYEPSPFDKASFAPNVHDRERLLPPPSFREPFRSFPDNKVGYRDMPVPTGPNDIPVHVSEPPRFRDGYRGGPPYREGQPPYREGQPPYRDGQPPFREGQPPYREGLPPFREGQPPFRDGQPPFRDGQSSFRDDQPPFRDGQMPFRDGQPPPFRDPAYRGPPPVGYRDNKFRNESFRDVSYRDNPNYRDGQYRGSRDPQSMGHHDANVREHYRDLPPDGKGRERSRERRRSRNRGETKRASDHDKNRDRNRLERIRDDRSREYRDHEKGRDRERDPRISPDKKVKDSPKHKKRSASRGKSRDRDTKRVKKDDKVKEKSSPDRNRDHKDKDKKIKDKKKKKKEKEDKKKKREKKDKKDKDSVKKEDDSGDDKTSVSQVGTSEDVSHNVSPKQSIDEATSVVEGDTDTNNTKNDAETTKENEEPAKVPNLYDDEESNNVDKNIIENYVQETAPACDSTQNDINKDESFDGIDIQIQPDELDLKDLENDKEMLAPVPELSKWEVDDDGVDKIKEPGEISSPDDKEGVVTSEILKRAEKAIFTKTTKPIEIKKISSDRVKLYTDDNKPAKDIQLTIPFEASRHRSVDPYDKMRNRSKTPPPKLSIKDRLGGKVDDTRKQRESCIVHSTVERVESRSKTPKKDYPYRRVTIDRSQRVYGKVESSVQQRRLASEAIKAERSTSKHKDGKSSRDSKNAERDKSAQNVESAVKVPGNRERKKSIIDEASFEPDYDETLESESEIKSEVVKKSESESSNREVKKSKADEQLAPKKKSETSSDSSSDSDSSSSTSSGERKRKRKKKHSRKKRKHASDSDSDSDTSSEDHKKKKKKRKHKKKSSKKKKKSKHK